MDSPLDVLKREDDRPIRTAHGSVLSRLRKGILTGVLPSGMHLVQTDIAAEFGVSTTPVREALRDLAGQGLVQLDTHRGAVVRVFDLEDMQEVFELRSLIEPYAVRRRVEGGMAEDLPQLEALQDQMDRTEDTARWLELNAAFHSIFTKFGHASRLHDMLESLQDATSVYVAMTAQTSADWMGAGNLAHREIIDACKRGDAERAAQLAREHIESTRTSVVNARAATAPSES